jgi:hypothetical protein
MTFQMKKYFLILLMFLLFIKVSFGQKNDFKKLSETEQKIINDLSSTFKDTNISFLLSPIVNNSIDGLDLEIKNLTIKYGFNKNDLIRQEKDTFLIEKNDYFKIINTDSLINWRKIDSKGSFQDPVLVNIEKHYGKFGLCSFYRIIFSKNRKYALVEYWMDCGFMCGYGETVLMKKKSNSWIIIEILRIIES